MTVDEQSIDVGGLPVCYLMAGEGPPLVLLHALGESALDWRWVLPALAHTHRVYAVDLPGFGYSGKPSAEYSPAFFTSFVGAYLDALGLERTALVGNSLGGLVALHLALSDPARVSALGLAASAGLGRWRWTTAPSWCGTARWRSPGGRRLSAPPKGLGRGCHFSSRTPSAFLPNG